MDTGINHLPPPLSNKSGKASTNQYQLLEVSFPYGQGLSGFSIRSTDKNELEWIVSELIKKVPNSKIEYSDLDLVTSQPYSISIDKLKGKDIIVVWMTLKILVKNGWKLVNAYASHPVRYYEFIKEQEC